jgi:geranylgeranyl diphosphate synthase type I
MKNLVPQGLRNTKRVIDARLREFFLVKKKESRSNRDLVQDYELLEEFCLRGGKRLRAYLVVLGYKIAGEKPTRSLFDVALGVELAHAALLIHDDIIDNDILRRGKPTLHETLRKKYQDLEKAQAAAILLGDTLFSLALEAILGSDFPDKQKVVCAKTLGFGSVSTAAGELMDIVYSHQNVSQKTVEKILLLKTARYSMSQPLLLGYALGNGKKYTQILKTAGEKFGTAFQIRDDTLGIVGAKSLQNRGSDLRESKPFILAPFIEKYLNTNHKKTIKAVVHKKTLSDRDVKTIGEVLSRNGISTHAFRLAHRYVRQAKKDLAKLSGTTLKKEIFSIIEYVLIRED